MIEALGAVDPHVLMEEIAAYVPPDAHVILSQAGIPDEHLFPLPVILEQKPSLVAYYRLLLGLPQKTFYGSGSGMGRFRSMEAGALNARQRAVLPDFCEAMIAALASMVRQIAPTITRRDVAELPLLTLGQQFQGGNNNTIGKEATRAIFLAIREILASFTVENTDTSITVRNAAGKLFIVTFAGDPDVRIQQRINGQLNNLVAIEIKGGLDRSNQHNRIGEAEKSHRKARNEGYQDYWTIIRTATLEMEKARMESPTTRRWFDTAQIGARSGPDWTAFRRRIARAVEIPVGNSQ